MGIKNLFFKEVDVPGSSQTVPQAAPQIQNAITGQEDSAIKEQLLSALEKANLPGYDYFEFAKAVDAQVAIIPSEATRFQAAAITMNMKIETLLSSAAHYLGILSKSEQEFLSALEGHSNKSIIGKEDEIKQLDADMTKMVEQIKALNEQINKLQESRTALTNELSKNKAEAERVKTNFYTTLNVISGRIKSDIEKIKTYLNQGK
jgi:predicted  nucleic acid-binding Zn-ribbon protein